jgi:dihydrofolate reductase
MRELILKMSLSLDGFVAGPNGEIDWIFGTDPAAKAWVLETVRNASLHIMGSRTFLDMAAYWPISGLPFAAPMNQIPKAVFSRQGKAVLKSTTLVPGDANTAAGSDTGQLQPGAQSWAEAYVAGGDLAAEIARLKAGSGRPILAHGGASFARSLIAENLVDEYALIVHPIILGKGLPIFSDLAGPRPLRLVNSKSFPGGAVAQIYRPA